MVFDPLAGCYAPKYSQEQYDNIVLHDANCLKALEHAALSPLDARKLFVTCDFRLAKIRRKVPGRYDFLLTVPEFYEFMLPYLFMDNAMVKQPVEMPNFLLASVVDRDLFETVDFKDLLGGYLANNIDNVADFKILEREAVKRRYNDLKGKYEQLSKYSGEQFEAQLKNFLSESSKLLVEYSAAVRESLAKTVVQANLEEREREVDELKRRMTEMENALEQSKKKLGQLEAREQKRKEFYKKRQRKKRLR